MRKIFRNLDLNTRLNVSILSVLVVVLSLLGFYIYESQQARITDQIKKQITTYLYTIDYILTEKTYEKAQTANYIAEYMVSSLSAVHYKDSVVVPFDKGTLKYDIRNRLKVGGEALPQEIDKYLAGQKIEQLGLDAYIIYKNGTLRYSQTQAVDNIVKTNLFDNIKFINDSKIHSYKFKWPENDENATERIMYLKYFRDFNAYVCIAGAEKNIYHSLFALRNSVIVAIVATLLLLVLILTILIKPISKQFEFLAEKVKEMSQGKVVEEITYESNDEIGDIVDSLNSLIRGLDRTSNFSKQLGAGNLDAEFEPLSDEDSLGNSLMGMRESLKIAGEERERQKAEEQERNWAAYGQAQFAEILRKFDNDITELSFTIISELVKYLDINQGGLFILNSENIEKPMLELTGCFAYDRRKYITKSIEPGDGLVGTCFVEKETIYMTDVPEGYMDIVSGLGDTSPRSILLVPLMLNEEIYGVIELASLQTLEKYKIEFVEKLGEIIASTISTVRNNMQTKTLLEKSQHQSEEMREQEEELRQNMEELQATQEEAHRREIELKGTITALNNAIGTIELDMDGTILEVNPVYLQISEMTEGDLKGKNLSAFKNKSRLGKYNELWNKLNNGEHYSGKFQYIFGDKEKWLKETFTPLRDESGEFYKVIGIVIDEEVDY